MTEAIYGQSNGRTGGISAACRPPNPRATAAAPAGSRKRTQFTFHENDGVPAGYYNSVFLRAEEYTDHVEQYGVGVKLVWQIDGGEYDGREAYRICSAKLSSRSNLYKFVVALRGSTLQQGDEIDLASYYGTRGMLSVEAYRDGDSTRVVSFLRS